MTSTSPRPQDPTAQAGRVRAVDLPLKDHGRGFVSNELFDQLGALDPFLSLTDFHMPRPYFPPHPHAGFSVMTYMFEDSPGAFINRDSFGDHSRIEPGALHWTQAGSGIQHEEVPEVSGVDGHGLQMWVNHAAEERWVAPAVHHVSSAEIPEIDLGDGGKARVLVGASRGVTAAFTPLVPITLLDVALPPRAVFTHDLGTDTMALALTLSGGGSARDAGGRVAIGAHTGVRFGASHGTVSLTAGGQGLRALLGAGVPFGGPIVFGGTFVMSSEADIAHAIRRFQAGEMGQLEPSVSFD